MSFYWIRWTCTYFCSLIAVQSSPTHFLGKVSVVDQFETYAKCWKNWKTLRLCLQASTFSFGTRHVGQINENNRKTRMQVKNRGVVFFGCSFFGLIYAVDGCKRWRKPWWYLRMILPFNIWWTGVEFSVKQTYWAFFADPTTLTLDYEWIYEKEMKWKLTNTLWNSIRNW